MTRKAWWVTGFLTVTGLAVGAELLAAFDNSPDSVPWTELLTDLPWWVTMPAALLLALWLPAHLWSWYRRRGKPLPIGAHVMTEPSTPPAAPDPNTSSTEPLLTVGGITTLVAAVLSLLVVFGIDIPESAKASILGIASILAPIAVALIGRSKVFSPATVARLLAARGKSVSRLP